MAVLAVSAALMVPPSSNPTNAKAHHPPFQSMVVSLPAVVFFFQFCLLQQSAAVVFQFAQLANAFFLC
jgi:hypothetical protein